MISRADTFRSLIKIIREAIREGLESGHHDLYQMGISEKSLTRFVLEFQESGARMNLADFNDADAFSLLGFAPGNKHGDEKKIRGLKKFEIIQLIKICENAIKLSDENLWNFALGYTLGNSGAERRLDEVLKSHDSIKNSEAGSKKRKPRSPKAFKEFVRDKYKNARLTPACTVQRLMNLLIIESSSGEGYSDFTRVGDDLHYFDGDKKRKISDETLRRYLKEFQSNQKVKK